MNKLSCKFWFFVIILILVGCDDDNDKSTNSQAGVGTRASRPVNGISFTNSASEYGIDIRSGDQTVFIAARRSGIEMTGFGLRITETPDGVRVNSRNFGINLDAPNAHYGNNTAPVIKFASSSMKSPEGPMSITDEFDNIIVYSCMWGKSESDCRSEANRINVLTYNRRDLPTPSIYFLPGAPRWPTNEIRRYFNDIVKQAVCEFTRIDGGTVIDVPVHVWNLKSDGQFHYPDAFISLKDWLLMHRYIHPGEPTLIVLPVMIAYLNYQDVRGVADGNFAVLSSHATLRDMLHEVLHLSSIAGLRDVTVSAFNDNIMYHLPATGTNLLYRPYLGRESQWNTLNLRN